MSLGSGSPPHSFGEVAATQWLGCCCAAPQTRLSHRPSHLPPRWHAPTPEEEVPRETGHLLEEILEEQHKQGAPALVPLVGWQGRDWGTHQRAPKPAWCTKFLEDSFPLPSLPGYRTAGQGGYTPAAAAPTQTGGAGGQGRAPRADERQRILSCRHTPAWGRPPLSPLHALYYMWRHTKGLWRAMLLYRCARYTVR